MAEEFHGRPTERLQLRPPVARTVRIQHKNRHFLLASLPVFRYLFAIDSAQSSVDFSDLDVVDPALLEPPPTAIHGAWRTDAAVVLDRELVALSGMHARCRLVQAHLARRFVETRSWRHLGFVRLGDYSRERLGLAPRTLEDDTRVVRALDGLPLLASALEHGEIPWSRVRALVRVATSSNEERLLVDSASVPLHGLDAFLRQFETRAAAECECVRTTSGSVEASTFDDESLHASAACTAQSTAQSTDEDKSEDDPTVRWSITVSRSGRRLWAAACAYASRMAGAVLSPAQVLELVAAEAMGSPGGTRWAPPPETHEQRLRARLRHDEDRGRRLLKAFLEETGVVEGFAWLKPASQDPGPAAKLDALLDGYESADAFELDRRLRLLRRAAQRIDSQMAALLHIGINRRLFREIGFATVKLYVESRLGCSARTVWSIVAVERESWRRSLRLREAFRDGQITHLAAAALLPVVSEKNAQAWIARAQEVTLRRLRDEVAWALDHGQPPSSSSRPWPPGPDADVRVDATGDVDAGEVQKCACAEADDASLGPPGAVRIEVSVPLSVAVLVETCLDHLQRDREARWQAFARMTATALAEWMAQPRHRDPVFERDGWRCTVPGCSSRRNLHDHHIAFRSQGGGNGRENRTSVCAAHHLHAIHAGTVRASGEAPHDIVWEMGCATGRAPLMRFVGDRIWRPGEAVREAA